MTDIHCHMLFGVDDGAADIEEALKMAVIAYKSGVTDVIATPHCNVPNSYVNYWNDELKSKYDILKKAVLKYKIPVNIYPGQEIFCTSRTAALLKIKSLITLNNTEYVLAEFGLSENPISVFSHIEKLKVEGYKPIIAHPERYSFIIEDPESIKILRGLGCLIQINKGSITGSFGKQISITADYILKSRFADFVASDAHSSVIRTPDMRQAYKTVTDKYTADYAEMLFTSNPAHVLHGEQTDKY